MSRRSKRIIARLWRGVCFGVVRASKQSRAHEVGRGTVGVGRDMRVEVQDEPPGRVAETMLCRPGVDAGGPTGLPSNAERVDHPYSRSSAAIANVAEPALGGMVAGGRLELRRVF